MRILLRAVFLMEWSAFWEELQVTYSTSYGGIKGRLFWYVTPCDQHFRRTCCFRRHDRSWSSSYQTVRWSLLQNIVILKTMKFTFTPTMKMEAADSSTTRVTTHQTVWCPNLFWAEQNLWNNLLKQVKVRHFYIFYVVLCSHLLQRMHVQYSCALLLLVISPGINHWWCFPPYCSRIISILITGILLQRCVWVWSYSCCPLV